MVTPKARPRRPAAASSNPAEGGFEGAVERLGVIVERLEGGDLPLEESLTLFEEGVALARAAQARLTAAEQRVEQLLGEDADGTPTTVPLEEDDE